MWIFCKDGFFSAVQHLDRPDLLLVRARFTGDLEKLRRALDADERKKCGKITKTPEADYLYRMIVPKNVFANYLSRSAHCIDYPNFKNAVHSSDMRRNEAYFGCWEEMRINQH